MRKFNLIPTSMAASVLIAILFFGSASASASSTLLKKGMQGSEVTALQKDLVKLGYLKTEASGFYGDATAESVKKLQSEYGYDADGVAGSSTIQLVAKLRGRNTASASGSAKEQSKGTVSTGVLKEGAEGKAVTELQKNLKTLGFLTTAPTGYFGSATTAAVKKLQKKYGHETDGVAGSTTIALVKKLSAGNSAAKAQASGGTAKALPVSTKKSSAAAKKQSSYLVPWFDKASSIFATGKVAMVYDIKTGLSFRVKRTYGYNHADCEALTSADTKTMMKIYGGSWSWDRRAVIITVGDVKMAASIAGMPHAGLDKYTANKTVSSRSGGFGRGSNLDSVKGNSMNGHIDIHFYGSRTHGTNKSDAKHQSMVKAAAQWANEHY